MAARELRLKDMAGLIADTNESDATTRRSN
jgi:hypothetical protein